MGQGRCITIEGPVADVGIFQALTIPVLIAFAGELHTAAFPVLAGVTNGARVTVVTAFGVRQKGAAAIFCTDIVGAWIPVIALRGVTKADPRFAVVGYGARVTVLALAFVEGDSLTPDLAGTDIFRTVVAIFAQIDVVPPNTVRFIHVPVTVIVNAVARLGHRHHGIAIRQAVFEADSFTLAEPLFIRFTTRCPESQLHGPLRTRADSRISDALQCADPIDCDCRPTRKTPRAMSVQCAGAAAEASFCPIAHTNIVLATLAGAVGTGLAGLAEIGKIGDTDIGYIGAGSSHLTTSPTRRALLLAMLGANCIPHVLDAPTGLAITVFCTGVEEAAALSHTVLDHLFQPRVEEHLRRLVQVLALVGQHRLHRAQVSLDVYLFDICRNVVDHGLAGSRATREDSQQSSELKSATYIP